jgi:sialate O-acetylesterase
MLRVRRSLVILGLISATSFMLVAGAAADVRLPAILSDNAVLQRGMPVPIWGWAEPSEKITVTIGQQSKAVTASSPSGKWMVKLDALDVGGPYTLTVAGKNTITLGNILVGEVWVCSGQSNMGWRVAASNNSKQEIAAATFPKIRLITVPTRGSQTPQEDFQGHWVECIPNTAARFSAVSYFFGRELYEALGVPIGLINDSYGASNCETWIRRDVLEADPQYRPMFQRYAKLVADYDPVNARALYAKQLAAWKEDVKKAKAAGKKPPFRPELEIDPKVGNRIPDNLYNGMLLPVIPYGIRGVIWYQGEGNVGRAYQYRALFPTLIKSWRADWQQGDFPFYFVQLANFMANRPQPQESAWAELREAQSMALKLSHTGQAVIIDIGDSGDIHPKNKQDVGKRLALWALAKDYGMNVVCCGPMYRSMEKNGSQIVVHFEAGGGLVVKNGDRLKGFAIAAADKKFVWADARIVRDTVVVSSPQVRSPVAVRYAWADNPVCNLYNKADLPASPFRTDDWPGVTINRN